MHKILIDTCVWLDIVKDYRQRTLLAVIEELVTSGIVELIVPRTIVDEFARNKKRVSKETRTSSSSVIKRAKDIAVMYADEDQKTAFLHQLNELDIRLPILSDAAEDTISRIEELFAGSQIYELTENITMRAAQRAIDKRAPFHRNRNQINDAIILESYADYIQDKSLPGIRFAFVTHNTNDFSLERGNEKFPHTDLSNLFSRIRSRYFIRLGEAVKRIDPTLVSDLMMEI